MKLSYAILIFSSALVSAQNNQTDVLSTRKFSAIMDMVFAANIDTEHEQSTFWKMITNYGCHCFPGYSRSVSGMGKPKNVVDSACRSLQRCKKCIEIEGFNGECENGDTHQGRYREGSRKIMT